ncbi:hypothetical protein [Hyphomonas sp.]|uniref:hypothetical protein n=1 Tax=Hyphomonas sp. TaxID=87 RepID=UPI0025C5E246|nr:hypothetical protein [Hyphomonas sp.]
MTFVEDTKSNTPKLRVHLPELKGLAKEFSSLTNKRIQDIIQARTPFLGFSPQRILHEQGENKLIRSDGSTDTTEMTQHSSVHETDIRDHLHFQPEFYEANLDEIAENFARSISSNFFEVMNKTTSQTGQVVDGTNKDILEGMLDALEMLPATEDEDDQPIMVVSPTIGKKLETLSQIPTDPEIQKRLDRINERKRLERHARKAGRKLVG